VVHCAPFRITRNADIAVRDDLVHDLLSEIEELLDERKLGNCVRLEIAAQADAETVAFLRQALGVDECENLRLARPARFGWAGAAVGPSGF